VLIVVSSLIYPETPFFWREHQAGANIELVDAEGIRKSVPSFQKIFFPHILNAGDLSSTKVFHGEHFFSKTTANRAFHSLSTDVDIDLQPSGYSH